MKKKKVSILGCGWFGLPLGEILVSLGYEVKGSTTSEEKMAVLESKGISAFRKVLPLGSEVEDDFFESDILIIAFPPGLRRSSEEQYLEKIKSILAAIDYTSTSKLIHISTTSIYPSVNRVVVEEDANQESVHYEAEQMLQKFCEGKNISFISLRCGGLMGKDRYPCKYIQEGKAISNGDHGVNYIHQDDVLSIATEFVMNEFEGVFNVVAPLHPLRKDVMLKCCLEKNLPQPVFDENTSDWKVVSSKKLIETIDYEFKYPNPLHFDYGF